MNSVNFYTFFCLVFMVKIFASLPISYIQDCQDIAEKPSQTRKIHLYSKHGHYISIQPNGSVVATLDKNSPNILLEMLSYNVNCKRIRSPTHNLWLAIDKSGRTRTRKKMKKDTLFYETYDDGWVWYQSFDGFVLAFRKNFQPKHRLTEHDKEGKRTKISIQYPKDTGKT